MFLNLRRLVLRVFINCFMLRIGISCLKFVYWIGLIIVFVRKVLFLRWMVRVLSQRLMVMVGLCLSCLYLKKVFIL